MPIKKLNESELLGLYEIVSSIARTAQLVPMEDLEGWQLIISKSHALGPIIDPTLYRNKGMDNLEEQQILLNGFMVFRDAIEKVKKLGKARR